MAEITVKEADVIEEPSDLLLLKYAQNFYGADKAVASRLISAGLCTADDLCPHPGESVVIEAKGSIAPKRVLFLGTPPLRNFTYDEMEAFARRAVEKIADLALPVRVLTTTIHGTGYGLDGGEALQRLVKGFREGLSAEKLRMIGKIAFLTLDKRERRMLSATLEAMKLSARATSEAATKRTASRDALPKSPVSKPVSLKGESASLPISEETRSVGKRRVFVALPFSEEYQNVYEFGIYPAVRSSGLICERVDETHFTGDVLARIKKGIEAADLVIADLSEARPNVYLEVGYAWGRNIPVIFVAKKREKLHFDVSTHRCIFCGSFSKFAKDLEELIRGIDGVQQH
jgi:hypothetical protein